MAEAGVDDPLLGKVLSGRFQIVEPLGVGGMGRVYKAIQQPLDRLVALKVLNPRYDGTKDPGFERRFFLEASMTAKLKHPNTITVHDYGRTDDGIYFIAMEYLEGETLQQVISREGRIPWQRALAIGAQVARSLREAHKLGLVHRDLKPANVMLLSEGTGGDSVKVLDFGLVKAFSTDVMQPSDLELTQAGVLLGSPLYMAPEQARGETDQRTDIYSLGVLLFQCMAGKPPFQGKESIDIIVKHVKEQPPELRDLVGGDLPVDVNELVMKCLSKDPAARYQSMDELLHAMHAAVSGHGISGLFIDPRTYSNPANPSASQPLRALSSQRVKIASPDPEPPPLPPRRQTRPSQPDAEIEVEITESKTTPGARTRLPLMIGAAVVIVLGLSVGGWVAFRTNSPQPVSPKKLEPAVVVPVPPKPVPPPVEVKREPVEVVFDVDSDPAGATVTQAGALLGTTPFSFSVWRKDEDQARAELVFALDGYQGTTVVASGAEGHVPIKPTLSKKKAPTRPNVGRPNPKPPPKNPDNGYKDDPYQ